MSKLSDMLLNGVMEDMSQDGYIQSNTIDRTADTDWWGQAFINAVHDKIGDVAVPRAVIFWSFFLVLSVAEGAAWKQLKILLKRQLSDRSIRKKPRLLPQTRLFPCKSI